MGFLHAKHSDDPRAGLFEVTGRIVRETEKAILLNDGVLQEWVPKKVKGRTLPIERLKDGTVEVSMPEWLAKQRGFV